MEGLYFMTSNVLRQGGELTGFAVPWEERDIFCLNGDAEAVALKKKLPLLWGFFYCLFFRNANSGLCINSQ